MKDEKFEDHQLARLTRIGANAKLGGNTECPDEHQLAAFFGGRLDQSELDHVQIHLADCRACVAHLILLGRLNNSQAISQTPELALARARKLVSERPQRKPWRVPAWATAAAVLLAFLIVVDSRIEQDPASVTPTERDSPIPTTRLRTSALAAPKMLTPSAGASVRSDDLEFHWTEVPGSLYYDIHIVNSMGDLVLKDRVMGTYWELPDSIAVESGAEYYVRVDAFLLDEKTVSSDHVSFRINEQH